MNRACRGVTILFFFVFNGYRKCIDWGIFALRLLNDHRGKQNNPSEKLVDDSQKVDNENLTL